MCSGGQQYCLRWNNHRSNLLSVFDQLLQNESFTDVTLACEGGASIKGHKMVLAACSGYFAALFAELPCKHPVVVLKDVRYADMKAILEYMYRGEVNVEQEQLAALLKVAETLKVKGLVEENAGYVNNNSKEEPDRDRASSPASPQSISTSTSPPHSTFGKAGAYHGHPSHMRLPLPLWHAATQSTASPLVHQLPPPPPPPPPVQSQGQSPTNPLIYDTTIPPHRRKLMSGLMLSRDTPILRTVLGQSQASPSPSGDRSQQNADSSQATQLLCNPDSMDPRHPPRIHSNGSTQDSDKMGKHDSTFDDDASPYTDISMNDDDADKKIIMTPSSSPQSYAADLRGVSSYVTPHQKPEWKRYKQYTRQDILSAIEAVRTGMSANQASTMYGVPSRTLYDKVKKLGITKNRPVKRASSSGGNGSVGPAGTPSRGGSNGFVPPYVIAGDASMRRHYLSESEDTAAAVEHWIDGNAAAAAAAVAVAAAQAAAHARGRSLSPGVSGPSAPKYMRQGDSNEDADEQDEVEDLSVSRKQNHSPPPPAPSAPPAPPLTPQLAPPLQHSQPPLQHSQPPLQHSQPPSSPHPVQPPLASRVIVSMHAARQEEERERERELERERERERDREREREMEREQEMGLREPPRVPIIVEDPRANPMEVGGERD